ncbi:zinc knuckle CX2CX4HX4C containing protein [Tanacetum coccineum]
MINEEMVQGANVAIPLSAVEEVSKMFDNTLYGYFIGKRLAFPVVENYVKNSYAKFGLERMMLTNRFFFFQFTTREGMERVLENGLWLIRLVPIVLNIWIPNTRLKKDTTTSALIWVKIHNVPIVAYSEVGLHLITSQLGHPIMLDAYTSTMCQKSWGRNTYARALVKVSLLMALKESLIVVIPFPNGTGHSLETVDVEYEWQLTRCETCKIFDHKYSDYPKREKVVVPDQVMEGDGFT